MFAFGSIDPLTLTLTSPSNFALAKLPLLSSNIREPMGGEGYQRRISLPLRKGLHSCRLKFSLGLEFLALGCAQRFHSGRGLVEDAVAPRRDADPVAGAQQAPGRNGGLYGHRARAEIECDVREIGCPDTPDRADRSLERRGGRFSKAQIVGPDEKLRVSRLRKVAIGGEPVRPDP